MAYTKLKTVPNQMLVKVGKLPIKKNDRNPENYWVTYNVAADRKAMKELGAYGYALYSYIRGNQANYTFALSRADFCEITGLSKNTYLKARDLLIEKGYLVKSADNSNLYTFYEDADRKGEIDVAIYSKSANDLPEGKPVAPKKCSEIKLSSSDMDIAKCYIDALQGKNGLMTMAEVEESIARNSDSYSIADSVAVLDYIRAAIA